MITILHASENAKRIIYGKVEIIENKLIKKISQLKRPIINITFCNNNKAPIIKNTGTTPAQSYARMYFELRDTNNMNTYTVKVFKALDSACAKNFSSHFSFVSEGVRVRLPDSSNIVHSQAMEDALNTGKINFYLWGVIYYKDFFGYFHTVHFCGTLDKTTDTFYPKGGYNTAD